MLSVKAVSELVYYAEDSPTWLRRKEAVFSGRYRAILKCEKDSVAGNVNGDGYIHVRINGKTRKGHVVVWELHNGPVPDGFEVDHKDGVLSNNHIDNLRLVSHAVNTRNGKRRCTNTSGYTGVAWHKRMGRWLAYWQDERGRRVTKSFNTQEEAIAARASAISELNRGGAGYSERHGT